MGLGERGRTSGQVAAIPSNGSKKFISYVGANPHNEEEDPDGISSAARLQLEARAIDAIIRQEPKLQRTVVNNEGFDLYEQDASGRIVRWIEVKSMTGDLTSRPVGVSHAQFDLGREKGPAFWLYIVENAGSNEPRILRIQDPAGKARTFTFDQGWSAIAQ
jgi:hypothetical protein